MLSAAKRLSSRSACLNIVSTRFVGIGGIGEAECECGGDRGGISGGDDGGDTDE
jgi:hypothetical protein